MGTIRIKTKYGLGESTNPVFLRRRLLNDKDITITSDWLKKTYYSKDEDNFSFHESTILGSFVSNMKSNFEYKHSGDWP